ncbi:pirin C-terminal cupin domain protein [Asticcacaulis biprosthecium C19]|uniref:Pirin C-terminal cupin domain protein n=1 Tax=Asticcacaulis biprosthecium C19 TaxID=715226 RepID=F4QLF0_9CAUL|nr:pirin family protein [Asticcacaulis biprosthecium]EGF92295.1 pirin C-terminal cupin domain protein [Asticcacaulis biprosthecium C19]
MSVSKTILRLHPAIRDDIGDLVTRRPVPNRALNNIGAFLFLNHHGPQTYAPNNRGLPFGPHPHRGFETVTFILEGDLAHRDSGGHESIIHAGGVQWMTAGSGLVHEEVSPGAFKRSGGPMEILQLWVNLPARLKMTKPAYTGVQADQIPTITSENATVHLVSGKYQGATGAINSLTGVFMTWIELQPGGRIIFDGLKDRDVFCYVVRGDVAINGVDVAKWNLVEFAEGDLVDIEAVGASLVLFGHAEPIREPIVAHGPFVMNTPQEIHQAYADYQAGKFG